MKIERIDVYWAKLPLAFVWKTSYGDQLHSDTILVRMEGGGQHAWGESCPVLIPNYSSEHTLAAFHTVREYMAPRLIGQDLETSRDLLDLIAFIKGRLVILDFMELRNAPLMWRMLLEGWLIIVSSMILLAYWISLK